MANYEYAGTAMIVTWFQGSGTNILSGKHTNFGYTPSIDYIDVTSGADTHKRRLAGVKDGSAQLEAFMQSGTNTPGTAAFASCAEGNFGTLQWQPEGTAVGKAKISMPANAGGAVFGYPVAGAVTVSVAFTQEGARTEGTN